MFLRALSLKFLDANNSIILIDEPEISLHPEWQRKIIKVYESIGKNNQLIIATHSPLVGGDIKLEQLRILQREKNKVTKVIFEYLRKYLGDLDKDIMLMNLEISRRKGVFH